MASHTNGENRKKIHEYDQCSSLRAPIATIMKDKTLNEAQKLDRLRSLRCDPQQCPLRASHPPNGFEFGLGCTMCADKGSEHSNLLAAAKAKQEADEKKQYFTHVANAVDNNAYITLKYERYV